MSVLALLVPVALLLGLIFVGFFAWAVSEGQYDDVETPAHRLLIHDFDSPRAVQPESSKEKTEYE